MDYLMPDMNGDLATILIRKIEKYNELIKVPIIGITANNMQNIESKCLLSGMNAVLTKPIPFEKLKKIIQEYY
jgi:CheY-like chemotaxis protein